MGSSEVPIERFPALEAAGARHGFVRRVPGIAVDIEKAVVLRNLDQVHQQARAELGLAQHAFITARQVHGDEIAIVDSPPPGDVCFEGADGIVTNQRNVCLGIYVADCCAIYLVDRQERAMGLVHSGRKGTELGIAARAIEVMQSGFGVAPRDLIVQLSPCIRPPHYEVDFAAEIVSQCRAHGVLDVTDSGICTACDLHSYYSYRAEKARTGRMLALLSLN